MADNCFICGDSKLQTVDTAVGRRVICQSCFHARRAQTADYAYESTTMCALGTHPDRLSSQVSFVAPFVPANARVLEIGCATGELAALMQQTLPIAEYEAIEFSPAADRARSRVTRLHRLPLPQAMSKGDVAPHSFDLVLISHVLEHIGDVHGELEAIRAVLSASGALFIEVPNRSGNPNLPFDDNVSHIHFFSANSLLHLLSRHGFECRALTSGARLDARYADSLRVVSQPFRAPDPREKMLSRLLSQREIGQAIVWGAGSLASEILANFLDPKRIMFFVDRDPAKQGKICLGRPVHAPEMLRQYPGETVLINSVDYEDAIRADLAKCCPGDARKIIGIAELFDYRPGSIFPGRVEKPMSAHD